MLEPLDAFQLGIYLCGKGEIETIEDVYAKYAHPVLLTEGFPIFVLNTKGNDDSCIFLENGRCSVYRARLRVCRIYPLTVKGGERGRKFEYYKCLDSHAGHFSEGSISVKEWMYQNFSRTDRIFFEKENKDIPKLGALIRKLSAQKQEDLLFHLLYYRYYYYDLDQPFLEQYERNQKALFRELEERTTKEA